MHIKLKTNLKLIHAMRKYKTTKFKFRCDYNVNMNRIMLAITILNKIHYNCDKCKTSELDANRHSNTVVGYTRVSVGTSECRAYLNNNKVVALPS